VSEEAGAGAQRLQKIIAAAGIASRRKAEELITAGRVQVNGQTVTELGAKADPAHDHIRVDGKLLHGAERPRYFVLNKPRGYVTTASDPEGRPTVMDFFKGAVRVFPVGRLDYSSEGLLLMTNDGGLANALTRAAARVEKTYLVKVSGKPSEAALNQLRHGVMIDRGTQIGRPGAPRRNDTRVMTAPARIRLLRDAENPWYELILIEGRNREIRKMFEEVGYHVEKIRRVGYGPLILDLEPGRTRELTMDEVVALRRAAEGKGGKPARKTPKPGKKPEFRRKPSGGPSRESRARGGEEGSAGRPRRSR
jgi:23S rRNA pseudouridine2605 synthase